MDKIICKCSRSVIDVNKTNIANPIFGNYNSFIDESVVRFGMLLICSTHDMCMYAINVRVHTFFYRHVYIHV